MTMVGADFQRDCGFAAAVPLTPVVQTSGKASHRVASGGMAKDNTSLCSNFNALSSPISENASLNPIDAPLGFGSAAFHRVPEPTAFTVLYPPGAFAISVMNVSGLIRQLKRCAGPGGP